MVERDRVGDLMGEKVNYLFWERRCTRVKLNQCYFFIGIDGYEVSGAVQRRSEWE